MTTKVIQRTESPFVKATTKEKRVKLFLWGQEGTYKTRVALQFPSPTIIDMEEGAGIYAGEFEFEIKNTTDADAVMLSIDWLLNNKHNHRTLIIDPITIYWAALQDKYRAIFMERKQKSPGYKFDFYEFQPSDWTVIKAEFKRLIRKIMTLDMNVIVTAHQKKMYSDEQMMKVIGDTFDGEKSLGYVFDIVVQTFKRGDAFMAKAIKDRTNKLPAGEFVLNYEVFENAFGKNILGREAKVIKLATPEQVKEIEGYEIGLEITQTKHQKLLAKYEVEQLADLTEEQATEIINRLDKVLTDRKQKVSA